MDTNWHLSTGDGETIGPLTLVDLAMAVREGRVQAEDHVWHEQLGDWKAVELVPQLSQFLVGDVTPPPVTPSDPQPDSQIFFDPSGSKKFGNSYGPSRNSDSYGRYISIATFSFGFAIVFIPLAVLVSQYLPITGGFMDGMAEPWSPLRKSLIPRHILLVSTAGFLVGGFIGELAHRSKAAAYISVAGLFLFLVIATAVCFMLAPAPAGSR